MLVTKRIVQSISGWFTGTFNFVFYITARFNPFYRTRLVYSIPFCPYAFYNYFFVDIDDLITVKYLDLSMK